MAIQNSSGKIEIWDGSETANINASNQFEIIEASNITLTAAAVITDNTIVRGADGARGCQDAGVTCDDSDNLAAINNLTIGGTFTDGTGSLVGGAWTGLTSVTVDNVVVNGNDISSSSGDITLTPTDQVVIDGHFEFDGAVLTALTDNDTTITAYAGKAIIIESITMDGGEITAGEWKGTAIDAAYIDEDVKTTTVGISIDGGGAEIGTGVKGYVEVPFDCTIVQATTLADQSGSIVIDVWKCSYTDFDAGGSHPVDGDSITDVTPPTISAATKDQDSTLTSWNTSITEGDCLAFNVDSVTDITSCTLILKVEKT